MTIKKVKIKVYDMTCTSCERRIEKSVRKITGVHTISADFNGQFASIEYNEDVCSLEEIKSAIKSSGYSTESPKDVRFIGIIIAAAAIILLGINTGNFDMEAKLNNASYVVLFVVGIITSLHCVGMCGGIMLSQSIGKKSKTKFEAIRPALLYNFGRVTAYTILGGIIGAIGSVFALSLTAKAGLQLFAGVFMIMMGFNMAGFKAFRKFQIRLPQSACKAMSKPRTPFIVGFLNGLMPCGPLQTMQIYALGTGSAVSGALSMFMFALGTAPLMLMFGALSGFLSKGYTKKILKFSGVLIIMLGMIMSNRGLALAGINFNPLSAIAFEEMTEDSPQAIKATIKDGVQVLNMKVDARGYSPRTLYIQKGLPVKWVLDVEELTSCNNSIVLPALNIQQKLEGGNNLIEFTPGSEDLPFSCWMGMKRGIIKVVDDLETISVEKSNGVGLDSAVTSTEAPSGNSTPSIYGSDLSLVATERLVKKTNLTNNQQTIEVKGIGLELEPLIIVMNKGVPAKMTLDLSSFDQPEGYFMILNSTTKQIVTDFNGINGVVDIEYQINEIGSFGIYLNEQQLIGVIEVVEDNQSTDIEAVRAKYLP